MEPFTLTVEGLTYALDRLPRREGGKCVVTVQPADPSLGLGEGAEDAGPADPAPAVAAGRSSPLVDRVDLYAFAARRRLASVIADAFGRQTGEVQGALAVVLDAVERREAGEASSRPDPDELTPERERAARALLELPDLLDAAAGVMEGLGYVGEAETRRLCYLVATSRLLRRPLSAILQAPAGCGKSELLEVTRRLLPDTASEFLSRLTPQALYYAGAEALRHKLIVVDEQEGAQGADYPLRTLQSKGYLVLRLPGRSDGQTFTVQGPIALMSGTTSAEINPENLSRCLSLCLDPSAEQTRRVQAAQRAAWARRGEEGAGGEGEGAGAVDLQPWQDAQRLLEPLAVSIPFAEELTFPARTAADRRGNQKLLGLVAAHALLFQRQRTRAGGAVVVEPADYRAVHGLLLPRVERELDGLSPRAARAYRALAEASGPKTRRDLASRLSLAYNTVKKALAELVAQELAVVCDPGPPTRYRILERSLLGAAGALLDPDALERQLRTSRRRRTPARRRSRPRAQGAGQGARRATRSR